jgi:hypothetical protein
MVKPITQRWSLRLSLAFAALDAFWAYSALVAAEGPTNPGASVSVINPVIWIFMHFPAAWLASLPFGSQPPAGQPMPSGELWLLAGLGVAQMAALGWWLGRRLDRRGSGVEA